MRALTCACCCRQEAFTACGAINSLDWRTNISRGATAQPLELTDELVDLARRSAAAVGASLGRSRFASRTRRPLAGDRGQRGARAGKHSVGRFGVDIAAVVLDFLAET